MRDLAEIRKYWPKTVWNSLFGDVYASGLSRMMKLHNGHWALVVRVKQYPERATWHVAATIAAVMAAAGFGERKPDKYARQREQLSRWVAECQRGEGDFFSMTQPQSRQRPHKKVRLGKRGRRLVLAASMGEALELVRQKRRDRRFCRLG